MVIKLEVYASGRNQLIRIELVCVFTNTEFIIIIIIIYCKTILDMCRDL